ncbi:TetR/AcrR family transcriptional regulator [Ilumatobacter nonamiensis]|uniref:TetR/AcrR family transcriptional regulator n=1 Tax=Ilumatobacter nonamiensis TaxID=467093 RepID=UPI000349EB25|nr:TetR/AcrR family transcriptional regulator [Ilumatobacter nonamiensis]
MPSSARSTTSTGRRTQGERRTEAETALLDGAERLFARKGLDATSLADIGAEAGYSRALVNHHFGTRTALVERLAARCQRRFISGLRTTAETQCPRGSDTLVAIADAYLDAVERDADRSRAFLVMWGSSFAEEAQLRPVFDEDDERFRTSITAVIRAEQEAGAIRHDVDADVFAVTFVALLRGIAGQFAVSPAAVDLTAARSTCAQIVHSHLEPTIKENS